MKAQEMMMFLDCDVEPNPRDQWYTPLWIIEGARAAFGGDIDLDPASCAEANETVQARRFIAPPDDGLRHEWRGNVWLNPPFCAGSLMKFSLKALESDCWWIMLGMVSPGAAWTENMWERANSIIHMSSSRVSFRRPSRETYQASKIPFDIKLFSNLPHDEMQRGFPNFRVR